MDVVDTHLHLWDTQRLRYPWLDATPELARPHLVEQAAVDVPAAASVVVQADCLPEQSLDEVRWVEEQAEAGRGSGLRLVAMVAAAPVDGPGLVDHLDRLAEHPLVTGVRRLLQDEPEGAVVTDAMLAGLAEVAERNLVFDVTVRHTQLGEVVELVRRSPSVRFVLDHLGKPPLRRPELRDGWLHDVRALAGQPNVVLKVSGLGAESDPDQPLAEQAAWYVRRGLELFGTDRAVVGSDWPVSSLGSAPGRSWSEWVGLVARESGASGTELDELLRGTARRTYRWDVR
ncbi:amidohydrolase family protein [Auraticoccus cholistanensis]|uniref:amidohydrolase family protein n=1 Tax=Auraticoccus cholistanensis TaxID=2656650 RepID=UPI0018D26C12|nr:amidohydrolase family protein [Auraticoccus cholistanensis]